MVRVDTSKGVRFVASSFLMRASIEGKGAVLRCFVRPLAGCREIYIQSGSNLDAFSKACTLADSNPGTTIVRYCWRIQK